MFTEAESEYLESQPLGRLATIGPDGAPQARPVGFFYDRATGTIDIGGYSMGRTQNFRNVKADGRFSFVVDDLASVDPWRPRGIEIRGHAEALTDQEPRNPALSREIIRLHPERTLSWSLDPDIEGMQARNVNA
ncbi:MAG: PPOX class F420-dependent oxidoreductase [Sciscionella sp.]